MNEKILRQRSKFLSLVLRHQPETIGIQLDAEGWTDVSNLLQQMIKHRNPLKLQELIEVVENNDKKRFQLSEDHSKIRAVQGHSTQQVQREYIAMTPPDILYHGTATRFVDTILEQGLIAGQRHHVHLSADLITATKVGQRHGKVVIFRVNTQQMQQDGFKFYQAENGVWLTEKVPSHYLSLMSK
ncbi:MULTISPECIES: RNA 2'-phosphotransferase [unclassified Acinetobacter]|uniref:RNA 2'-phosphotransferase n=1 Tax=unclassified Acinetobacter TaxID=196816 RepID=UPI002575D61A|nr:MULTISPECIES: RNA 2'-phosphotransferase [unclassified Acinetobacter]MDM1763737.1 RNA 2'-phosphotransferase [Acinetobacter sp. 226-1]MDM1767216.1 RNA 2'-phosphotransferase [Acinetobacter sp. 226-4]